MELDKLKVCILLLFSNIFHVIYGKIGKVYEENPFFNGEFQPGIHLPQGPVNDPTDLTDNTAGFHPPNVNYKPNLILPTTSKPGPIGPITPPIIPDDLYKYCLQPRGQFQGPYCNSFVNCWDGNAVKQFCGASLVYNPKGYCDYTWNVNCNGKPIKDVPTSTESHGWPSDGSYAPPPTHAPPPGPKPTIRPPQTPPPYRPGGIITIEPPGFGLPQQDSNGWPTDGSYVPPPTTTHPSKPTLHPPQSPPPYHPGGIFTIEPPGFGQPQQDPIPQIPPVHPPHHPPHHDHTHRPLPTTTWKPTIVTQPPAYNELRKYCLHPRGQFAGPHCHKFINCWDDVAIEQDCPDGLNFNPNKHYCDFPYNYPCRKIKEGGSLEYPTNHLDEVSEDNKLDSY